MLVAYARRATVYLWILFIIVWFSAALTSKPREKSAGSALRLPFGLILLAVILLFNRRIGHSWLATALLPNSPLLVLPGAALTIAGMGIAFWARYHLGRNWGPAGTMRVGHELVTSGPYAHIRHPIYVSVGIALVGTALAIGNVLGIVIAALVLLCFSWAVRVENQLLVRQFGEQAERR